MTSHKPKNRRSRSECAVNVQYNGKTGGSLANSPLHGGVLKAAANLGCVVGQVMFGTLGDIFGRRRIYPAGLIVAMFGVVMTIACPSYFDGPQTFTWITVWRVIMGIGIGGDYPMSASVVSDRANLNRRGLMLAFIFSMQGWGNFAGGIVSIIVLACFRQGIHVDHHVGQFNAVWRIIIGPPIFPPPPPLFATLTLLSPGLILVPAAGTLYQRIVLPESAKMKAALALRKDPTLLHKQGQSDVADYKKPNGSEEEYTGEKGSNGSGAGVGAPDAETTGLGAAGVATARKAALRECVGPFPLVDVDLALKRRDRRWSTFPNGDTSST